MGLVGWASNYASPGLLFWVAEGPAPRHLLRQARGGLLTVWTGLAGCRAGLAGRRALSNRMSVSAPVARPHSRSAALKAALETSRWLPPPAPSCLSSHSLNNFITRPACSARTSRSCCSVMEGPCLLPWRSPGALLASIASQLSACGLPLTEWSVTERAQRSVS